ncbi:MAG: Ni/Fe hydrogenase [Proteobacteria bacterium]|nr:MAG: Ni/Fe hydrogenase [Pseudomonadota bacterium]
MSRIVVLAAGNAARGDDGIGPALLARLAAEGRPEVALVDAFQFQVEHALDLAGAEVALFIDAHLSQREDVRLDPVQPAAAVTVQSHALSPAEVLRVSLQIGQVPPPSWLLSVRGEDFALGAPLSPSAQRRIALAWEQLQAWLAARSVPVQS